MDVGGFPQNAPDKDKILYPPNNRLDRKWLHVLSLISKCHVRLKIATRRRAKADVFERVAQRFV